MYSPISLVVITLLGAWGASGNFWRPRTEVNPWWLWTNVSEAAIALEPEELPYEKPTQESRINSLIQRRQQRQREQSRRPLSLPSLSSPAARLQRPTTNVTDGAEALRFFVCCVCVPEYTCARGIPTMNNVYIDDYDVNYEKCPFESDVCCPVDDAPRPCKEQQIKSIKRSTSDFPKITPECECLHHELCPDDLVVNFRVTDPRSVNNNLNCSNRNDVCCSLSDLPITLGQSSSPILSDAKCVCVEQSVCDVMVHLTGITREDYLKYIEDNPPQQKCDNSHVCCSLPPDLPTSHQRLLLQSPAVAYNDERLCYGYFNTGQLPAANASGLDPWHAQFGELPWVALLRAPDGSVRGAGALIHPRLVLTVAHPFSEERGGLDGLSAVVGEWDQTQQIEPLPSQEVRVQEMLVHPLHTPEPLMAYDVAILVLAEEVERTPNVQTICLGESADQVDQTRCVVSGWGALHPSEQAYSRIQKRVLLPVVDRSQCTAALRQTSLGENFVLHDTAFCAGATGRPGTCVGDQGGPLACPSFKTGQYLLMGALSGGVECGTEGIPDIFTNFTGPVLQWVHGVLMERYGKLEEPLPEPGERETKVAPGPGTTAGSFYYDDGECTGYRPEYIQHSAAAPLQPDQAQLGELPWVALLLNNSAGGALVAGGGALIHPRVVLTTATRVNSLPVSDMVVTLGEWNRTSLSPALPRQDHLVQEYVLHPLFNATSQDNDMALIILREPAVNAPNVQSICLTRSLDEVDRTNCVSGAWGIPHQATFEFVSIQKRIRVPYVGVERCTSLLRQTPLGPDFFLFDSFFCGGGVERPGTCMGDEGSPLACPSFKDGRYMLVGALSGGIQCGTQDVPDIYKSYMDSSYDWVKEAITQRFPLTSRSAEKEETTDAPQNSNTSESDPESEKNIPDDDANSFANDSNSPNTDGSSDPFVADLINNANSKESNSRSLFGDQRTHVENSFDTNTLLGSFSEDGCSAYKYPGQLSGSNAPLTSSQAEHGELPWVVVVQDVEGTLLGAGALIHPRVVVTAASYLTNRSKGEVTAVLGEWNRQMGSEQHSLQMLSPLAIEFHPDFNGTHNDIALILLEEEAKSAPHVQSVCLARSLEEVDRSRCVVSGWGTLGANSEQPESIQKRILGPARPRAECEAELREALGPDFALPESFICAGGIGGPSVCQGDEGAPLMCPSFTGHHYLLVGVLSGGIECGVPGIPDIYSSVIHHRTWIMETVLQKFPTEENVAAPLEISDTTLDDTLTDDESAVEVATPVSAPNAGKVLSENFRYTVQGSFTEDGTCKNYVNSAVLPPPEPVYGPVMDVALGELPFTVILTDVEGHIRGAGALIHPRMVVTSPSALKSKLSGRTAVLLGQRQYSLVNPEPLQQRDVIDDIVDDASYRPALLILNESAVATAAVQSICLAQQLTDVDSSRCAVADWASVNSPGLPSDPVSLRRVLSSVAPCADSQEDLCAYFWHACPESPGAAVVCPSFGDGLYRIVGVIPESNQCSPSQPFQKIISLLSSNHDWVLKSMKDYFSPKTEQSTSVSMQSEKIADSTNLTKAVRVNSAKIQDKEAEKNTSGKSSKATTIEDKSFKTLMEAALDHEQDDTQSSPDSRPTGVSSLNECAGYKAANLTMPNQAPLRPGQSQYGEHPWVILLQECEQSGCYVAGTGALVHPQLVVTTASAVLGINPGALLAVAGEWDRNAHQQFRYLQSLRAQILSGPPPSGELSSQSPHFRQSESFGGSPNRRSRFGQSDQLNRDFNSGFTDGPTIQARHRRQTPSNAQFQPVLSFRNQPDILHETTSGNSFQMQRNLFPSQAISFQRHHQRHFQQPSHYSLEHLEMLNNERREMTLTDIVFHPEFNSTLGLGHDAAILVLQEPFELSPTVQTICLANSLSGVDRSRCIVNGWGTLDEGSGQNAHILKRIHAPILDNNTCEDSLSSLLGFRLHETQLCAGGLGGPGVCAGDEGAPLACPSLSRNGQYQLVGALTGGVQCNVRGLPDFYASFVQESGTWIRSFIANFGRGDPTDRTSVDNGVESEFSVSKSVSKPSGSTTDKAFQPTSSKIIKNNAQISTINSLKSQDFTFEQFPSKETTNFTSSSPSSFQEPPKVNKLSSISSNPESVQSLTSGRDSSSKNNFGLGLAMTPAQIVQGGRTMSTLRISMNSLNPTTSDLLPTTPIIEAKNEFESKGNLHSDLETLRDFKSVTSSNSARSSTNDPLEEQEFIESTMINESSIMKTENPNFKVDEAAVPFGANPLTVNERQPLENPELNLASEATDSTTEINVSKIEKQTFRRLAKYPESLYNKTKNASFRSFQHYANDDDPDLLEKVLLVPPMAFRPLPSDGPVVSGSYSSVVQYRSRGHSFALQKSFNSPEDADEPCQGYEHFGSGGAFDTQFGEHVSQFGEYPWMAVVLQDVWQAGELVAKVRGSGSLVHPQVVLTSAGAVSRTNVNMLQVRVGEWDLSTEGEPLPHQTVAVARVVVHPDYDPTTGHYDVAIILLRDAIRVGAHAQPICLASSFAEIDPSRCLLTGWAAMAEDNPYEKPLLKRLPAPLISGPECQEMLQQQAEHREDEQQPHIKAKALHGDHLAQSSISKMFRSLSGFDSTTNKSAQNDSNHLDDKHKNHTRLHKTFVCAASSSFGTPCLGVGGSSLSCPSMKDGLYRLVGLQTSLPCPTQAPVRFSVLARADKGSLYSWVKSQIKRTFQVMTSANIQKKVVFR